MSVNVSNYTEQGGARTVIGGEIDIVSGGSLKIAGTAVSASAAELNILDGVTSTATQLNNAPLGVFAVADHDYDGAHADWTLSEAENKAVILTVSNADQAASAIATPTAGKVLIVYNATTAAVTVKAAGQTGVAVATTKTAILRGDGTDFVRVTADA
jgi:hypothetical protein